MRETFKQTLFFAFGCCIGTISMYGFLQIYILLSALQNNAVILAYTLLLTFFSGLLFGTLLIIKDYLYPSKFKILTKLGNPLRDEELEIVWKWSNGATIKELGLHRMTLNRIVRAYCRETLKKK